MPSQVFEQLLAEQIDIFRHAFSSVSKATFYNEQEERLIHAGEFGMYREAICRDFLRFFIPARLDISQGFLINSHDKISSQCDIVIYDRSSTPLIQSESRQRFFPVETVCAIGEVKSTISQPDLREALSKLAEAKQMKDEVKEVNVVWQRTPHRYDPENHLSDQLFTFLICEKFEFSYEKFDPRRLYEDDVLHRHRHNIVLSLQDGALLYCLQESGADVVAWPTIFKEQISTVLDTCILEASSENTHLKWFVHFMFYATTTATILYPDLAEYMTPAASYRTGRFPGQHGV